MELYFLRHAEAVDRAPSGRDADRSLTDRGRRDSEEAAAGMRRLGLRFDRAISSPYIRARETAEIILRGVSFEGRLEFSDALAPGAGFEDLRCLLNDGFKSANRVLLVGHNPSIGVFAGRLASGAADVSFEMKKASLCVIDAEAPFLRGILRCLLTPELLILLSKGS